MKRAGIILISIGILATLWGAFALMMAFQGFTMDTSYLGSGTPGLGYSVTADVDSDGNFIPITEEQTAAAAAEYDVVYQANIKSHKTRGALMLGGGIVALVAGIVMTAKGGRKTGHSK